MSLVHPDSLARVVAAAAADAEAVDGGRFPEAAVAALRAEGLLGLLSSPEVGGLGGSLADAFTVVHALSSVCGSAGMVACMHYCGAAVIEKAGDRATREALARGAHLSTLAFSEAGSRSHF
jgi:alkylation response protein AidB-like acyl-CoA dehydrogenase